MKHSYNAVATKNKNQHSFQAILNNHGLTVSPVCVDTLWMNITRLCNQSCAHCHVDASPKRNEQMNRRTIDTCLELLSRWESCRNMDITGGAPELSDSFEYLVSEARRLDKHVVVRSNITVFFDGNPQTGEKKTYLPEFFAQNQVEILASLPHYTQEVTNSVRGQDAFEKSIKGLQLLNEQGYGKADGQLILNLVNNWDGSISPSEQAELERMFRDKLMRGWGIVFNRLFTVFGPKGC